MEPTTVQVPVCWAALTTPTALALAPTTPALARTARPIHPTTEATTLHMAAANPTTAEATTRTAVATDPTTVVEVQAPLPAAAATFPPTVHMAAIRTTVVETTMAATRPTIVPAAGEE